MIRISLDKTLKRLNISRYELAKRTGIQYQVIDNYFGRIHMRVAFVGEDRVAVSMFKIAEDFMNEYEGYVQGKSKF